MKREVVIIGGGPAGLAAAIEAKRDGCDVLLVDENRRAEVSFLNSYINFLAPGRTVRACEGLISESSF